MSCNGCSTGPHGKPTGCRSNGTCTNGGCNRLNTFNWLSDLPELALYGRESFMEVSFKNGARKDFFRNMHAIHADRHEVVVVESGSGGYDIGVVSITGELARLQMKRKRVPENSDDIRSVLRKANEYDLRKWEESRAKEMESMVKARAIARQMGLEMKIGDVEYQGDGRKATFYYTADERVDFRELIKVFAKEFHVKIEMHQIGARKEAGRIGGIGSCGRELCCSTWLSDFKNVSTAAARYQQLSINQAKLSGQCGRLKCCLNYELDTYLDALQTIPHEVEKIETETGMAYLQKIDVFRHLMWFAYKSSAVHHPVSPERVKEIYEMNMAGQKPVDLGAITLHAKKAEEKEEYTEVVGQLSLETLEKNRSRHKKQGRGRRPNREKPGDFPSIKK